MEKREPSYAVGGNANWYSHYGEQHGDSIKKKKKVEIELLYDPAIPCWAYTSRIVELKETHVFRCSLQHCVQYLGHGSNLDVHWQTNG